MPLHVIETSELITGPDIKLVVKEVAAGPRDRILQVSVAGSSRIPREKVVASINVVTSGYGRVSTLNDDGTVDQITNLHPGETLVIPEGQGLEVSGHMNLVSILYPVADKS